MNERSKYLSYLLRHKPEKANLTIDPEGWVWMPELLANTDFTRPEIEEIVRTDDKQRYALSEGGLKIRANQGHSTDKVRISFQRAVPPTVLYHGTTSANLARVLKEGLKPMSRHHVHLSAAPDVARDVGGRRKGEATVLEIDAKQMLADGVKFFRSENNVWLVTEVKPKYFKVIK